MADETMERGPVDFARTLSKVVHDLMAIRDDLKRVSARVHDFRASTSIRDDERRAVREVSEDLLQDMRAFDELIAKRRQLEGERSDLSGD